MRLSIKLPLLAAAAVIAMSAAAGTVAVRAISSSVEREAGQRASERVQVYAGAVRAHLDDAALALEMTAQNPEVAGFEANVDAARTHARALVSRSDVFEYVMLVRPDAVLAMVEPVALEGSLTTPSVAHQSWYRDVVASAQTLVSDLVISTATQRPSVVIATPVRALSGQVVGELVGGLRLDSFSRFANVPDPKDRGASVGYLTDGRGLIIAHQTEPAYVTYQTDFSSMRAVRLALAGESGSGRWVNTVDGTEQIGAYVALDRPHWAVVVATPVAAALAPVWELERTIASASIAFALLLAVAVAVILRRITRPLRELAAASALVAAGQRDVRVAPASGEVGDLADRFNEMIEALAERDDLLRRRADDLESLNHELEAFSYSVSHDLRAPLRSIDGFSQILLEDYGASLDGDAHEHLDRVRAAAQRMSALIDDLLALSRVAQGELLVEPLDVTAMATRLVGELRAADPDRRVEVHVDDGLVVEADRRMAEVVLRNLLGNAWKFTANNPAATIHLGAAGRPGALYVADNGAGFDMANAGQLFAPFQRFHHTSEFPGSGVGLATVARILRRHGGQIRADAAPGVGATFTFSFAPDPAAPSARDTRIDTNIPSATGWSGRRALVPERQP